MKSISLGLFLVALTTLMLELTLIRVFDITWYPNMAYMVITLAMFCFGLSGIYNSIRPLRPDTSVRSSLAHYSHLFALLIFLIYPVMNGLPFDFHLFSSNPVKGTVYFMGIYFVLALPFFFAGLIFTVVFSAYAKNIQRLYFYDLAGAAVGCYLVSPLLPFIGTGGLVLVCCGLVLLASALFSESKKWMAVAVVLATVVILIPVSLYPGTYLEFKQHSNKRGLKHFKENGLVERTHWDPISKIDVVNLGAKKFLAYDGGSQSSYIYPFDGDYDRLRELFETQASEHCWGKMVLASHWLKRDSGQKVMIIGAAGGQETKAALTYGAAKVDSVELVGYVLQLGKEDYAEYNGGIFTHENVNPIRGEGRNVLGLVDYQYDIIQMFSNHTSSSIASGSGAMSANYLQTVEAYEEYFAKLSDDGILHINHHVYPRMIATAAAAWKNLSRKDFQKHVLVFEKQGIVDNLPTILIKMSPWTEEELGLLQQFLGKANHLIINPFAPENNFLSAEFFTGTLSKALVDSVDFKVAPPTDNQPFFNFLRKRIETAKPDNSRFMNISTAGLLNSQLDNGVPMDIIHLIVTGIASLLFAGLFILLPMKFSDIGRHKWNRKGSALVYFACLGTGFIIIELVFIQLFMRLIGFPLYTYSTVIFSILMAAAIGSFSSGKMNIDLTKRWYWPFVGILVCGLLLLNLQTTITDMFILSPLAVRIAVTAMMIFPLGFFMGMPFPLGILALEKERAGAIGWAWGVNGLFTVVGGLLSVILAIFFGFKVTILFALAIYCLALLMISRMRTA